MADPYALFLVITRVGVYRSEASGGELGIVRLGGECGGAFRCAIASGDISWRGGAEYQKRRSARH